MKKKNQIIGKFRANEKGFGFVAIDNREDEIFIAPKHINGSLNGDTVAIEIFNKRATDKSTEGRIIKVIKRDKKEVIGTFQKNKNFGFVVPDDRKINTDIFISKKHYGKAKDNQKVVVEITKYPTKGKNAEGRIKEIIGRRDEVGVDMMSVIKEYELPYEFPKQIDEELKNIKDTIDEDDIKNRVDFRNDEIFTIDGEDAKDLDDAISIEKKDNGNFVLGVHIADVSNYVKEGSFLNKEAIDRGTSVYMFDRVIPMLPTKLSNGICSLNQGVDRFTLSIIMEINSKGKVLSSKVCKGIINVTRRMSYTNVTKILEKSDKEVLKEYKQYINKFETMEELAKILKQRRIEAGYLDLNLPESKIILNDEGVAIDVKKYDVTIANEIIEQFMLTANEQIAEKFYNLHAPFIYRVHEIPDIDKIKELNKFLHNLGYKIRKVASPDVQVASQPHESKKLNLVAPEKSRDFSYAIRTNKDTVTPKAVAKVLDEIKGTEEERVVSNLILRTLKLARYESENDGHFGIASKYYCHFTSPIRRYPDLFIHRVISKYLSSNYNIDEKIKEKYLGQAKKYAKSSSEREKVATTAEREAEDIKKAEYMQDKIGEVYVGVISSITQFGIFVELDNTIEGMIRFENLGDDYYIYDEENKTLIGEHTKEILKIGQKIKVQLIEADKYTRRISFARINE